MSRPRRAGTKNAWLLYADVYAFGSYLVDDKTDDAIIRLENFQRQLIEFFNKKKISSYFIFSDTVVLWENLSLNKSLKYLQILIDNIISLQKIALKNGWILRGAISFGDIVVNKNYILGNSYIKSYILEDKRILRPLIVIPDEELRLGLRNVPVTFTLEEVETKNGETISAFVVKGLSSAELVMLAGQALAHTSDMSDVSKRSKHSETWHWFLDMYSQGV